MERILHKEYGYSYTTSPSISELTYREIERLMQASEIDGYVQDWHQRKQIEEQTGQQMTLSEGQKKALRRMDQKAKNDGTVLDG